MFQTPTITIPNAKIGGQSVTGVFKFPENVAYEFAVETDALFQSHGATGAISSVILDAFEENSTDLGEGLRQELSVDIGMGRHVISIDFRTFTGSPYRWGDSGNGGTITDATGEDVHAQAAVLDKYLNTATLDSTNPAILEVGEYSEEGRYAPIFVVPRNPNIRFASNEESSTVDGSIDWVETQSLDRKAPQEDR